MIIDLICFILRKPRYILLRKTNGIYRIDSMTIIGYMYVTNTCTFDLPEATKFLDNLKKYGRVEEIMY